MNCRGRPLVFTASVGRQYISLVFEYTRLVFFPIIPCNNSILKMDIGMRCNALTSGKNFFVLNYLYDIKKY